MKYYIFYTEGCEPKEASFDLIEEVNVFIAEWINMEL
jgi:hypothetical protein